VQYIEGRAKRDAGPWPYLAKGRVHIAFKLDSSGLKKAHLAVFLFEQVLHRCGELRYAWGTLCRNSLRSALARTAR